MSKSLHVAVEPVLPSAASTVARLRVPWAAEAGAAGSVVTDAPECAAVVRTEARTFFFMVVSFRWWWW